MGVFGFGAVLLWEQDVGAIRSEIFPTFLGPPGSMAKVAASRGSSTLNYRAITVPAVTLPA